MVKMIRTLKRILAYHQLSSAGVGKYQVDQVNEPEFIQAAQRLHAQVYLDCGYVDKTMLTPDGRLSLEHDPYQLHADCFVVTQRHDYRRQLIATARQIRVSEDLALSHHSFPTFSRLKLYIKERERITKANPSDCVEISALAKLRTTNSVAVLLLYRTMWHHSLRVRHQLWLMACDAKLYGRLKLLFGDTLVQAGPETYYMGSKVVPAILEVPGSLELLRGEVHKSGIMRRGLKRRIVNFFLSGAPL